MNIDEGRTALWFADILLPIKSWKEILYVGACPDTFQKWGGDFFLKYIASLGAIFKCTIVEKHRPYAEEIQSRISKRCDIQVICEDIIEYVKWCEKKFDVIIWWHGPEHVYADELELVLQRFEKMCKLIILGCPEGEQDYCDSETGDTHKTILRIAQFLDRGYEAWFEDRRWKIQGPAITAIKRIRRD